MNDHLDKLIAHPKLESDPTWAVIETFSNSTFENMMPENELYDFLDLLGVDYVKRERRMVVIWCIAGSNEWKILHRNIIEQQSIIEGGIPESQYALAFKNIQEAADVLDYYEIEQDGIEKEFDLSTIVVYWHNLPYELMPLFN